jgi:hypothetical protein
MGLGEQYFETNNQNQPGHSTSLPYKAMQAGK